jgi:hypothetical protein
MLAVLPLLVTQPHHEALGRAPLAPGETAVAVAVEALQHLLADLRRQAVTLTLHARTLHARALHARTRPRAGTDGARRRRQLIGERGGGAAGEEETDEEHDSLHALPTRGRRG